MRLGAALLDARRFDEAEGELRQAYAVLEPLKDRGPWRPCGFLQWC